MLYKIRKQHGIARHLCKHTSTHEAMQMDEKMDLYMIWAALIRPKTVAKMTKTRGQNTHTRMHMLRPTLRHKRGILKHT